MKHKSKIILAFGLFFAFFKIQDVNASCVTTGSGQNQYNNTVAIQGGSFSVGESTPIGTVIRKQRVIGLRDVRAFCSTAVLAKIYTFNGTLYPGETSVWKTGVDGLGVRFLNLQTGTYYSTIPYQFQYSSATTAMFSKDSLLAYDIEFVKMGAVTPGVTNVSAFPIIVVDANDASNTAAWAMRGYYSGSITIQSPSCTTPDYDYNLGRYGTSSFSARGDASAWIATPVVLTNCSSLAGNNSNSSFTQYAMTGTNTGAVSESGSLAPVNISMSLTPVTGAIDSSTGILALDNTSTATGFGVQLGFNNGANTYAPQNLDNEIIVSPTVGTLGNVTFPMGARIIKTADAHQPGTISTSVRYTITYK